MKTLCRGIMMAAAVGAALATSALPAQAQPLSSAPYGSYAHEGDRATGDPCPHGSFSKVAQGGGLFVGTDGLWHSMHVDLLYYGGCGAIAETTDLTSSVGTPRCWAYIDRSDDGGNTWVNEVEAMTYGDGTTRIANDLNGRLARGAVVCSTGVGGPSVVGRTSWY